MQDEAVSSLTRNKNQVDSYYKGLVQKESEWREKLEDSLSKEKHWEQVRLLSSYQPWSQHM